MSLITFNSGQKAKSSEVNANFTYVEKNSPYYAPIGCIIAWHKTFTNTPALPVGWVECNGQTLSDATSVYNGQVIPDLNGENRFLRGASTSGTMTSTGLHNHIWSTYPGSAGSGNPRGIVTNTQSYTNQHHYRTYNSTGSEVNYDSHGSNNLMGAVGISSAYTAMTEAIPKHMTVVWIMRVK